MGVDGYIENGQTINLSEDEIAVLPIAQQVLPLRRSRPSMPVHRVVHRAA